MLNLVRIGLPLVMMASANAAAAQNVTADYDQIASAMNNAGYQAQMVGEGSERRISSSSGGYKFQVFFYGCNDEGDECKTIQFFSGFSPENKPSLEAMNAYAAKYRWGRIYLDSDGDPCIEMDVDLEDGGVSPELFEDNLEYWVVAMDAFSKFAYSEE